MQIQVFRYWFWSWSDFWKNLSCYKQIDRLLFIHWPLEEVSGRCMTVTLTIEHACRHMTNEAIISMLNLLAQDAWLFYVIHVHTCWLAVVWRRLFDLCVTLLSIFGSTSFISPHFIVKTLGSATAWVFCRSFWFSHLSKPTFNWHRHKMRRFVAKTGQVTTLNLITGFVRFQVQRLVPVLIVSWCTNASLPTHHRLQ